MRDTPPNAQWCHYSLWEDWENGLYDRAVPREAIVGDCVGLLSNPDVFIAVLREVIATWPYATAQNLSNVYKNHQPWCGRAACSYELGATMWEVNEAWGRLTDSDRIAANQVADIVTFSWRSDRMLGQMVLPT